MHRRRIGTERERIREKAPAEETWTQRLEHTSCATILVFDYFGLAKGFLFAWHSIPDVAKSNREKL